ncbi:MAG: DUF1553 domain-containing protein [Planctomycetes bacterium]|nr:DUF1553 domain-containing protein [Planctomycetota bacterium]
MSAIRAASLVIAASWLFVPAAHARPRYRHNLKAFYGEALAPRLHACTTCHLPGARAADPLASPGPAPVQAPPHNPFGARLKAIGVELEARGGAWSLAARLRAAAHEDSDSDGVENEVEILAGCAPGDPADRPSGQALEAAIERQRSREREATRRAWEPFQPVVRPPAPAVEDAAWARSPIDRFIARGHEERGLVPRPEAPRHVLLRRAHLALTGLAPAPADLRDFLEDDSPDAYERVVDRLLASPRHGERWARHWMDVWRYSDWAGWGEQVRDSQPHIWRWRDWIVESLDADAGYDRMVLEMLAGDELAPRDKGVLRATGYLARSFKLLSREAWMQEAVDHAAQGFLGVTLGCARCHDHMYDPISQREYYEMRAVFEPYNVRLDRLPGEPDVRKDGLARAFDAAPEAKTFVYFRGDDRRPDKDHAVEPGVPAALCGLESLELRPQPVSLPLTARVPEKEEHVVRETREASAKALRDAKAAFEAAVLVAAKPEAGGAADSKAEREARLAEMAVQLAEAKHAALAATLEVEGLEDSGARDRAPEAWAAAATEASRTQRWARLLEARRGALAAGFALADAQAAARAADAAQAAGAEKAAKELDGTKAKLAEAEKALEKAKAETLLAPSTEYARREVKAYPAASTGRRLAFARWIADRRNPLAARVAANHIWLRHFGRGIAASPADLGANGQPPTHPELLDWLAVELMEPSGEAAGAPWSMKRIHRSIVTSATYRMASTPDERCLAADPEDRHLWRMPSRRLEAEAVRDNVLAAAEDLDETRGGPELDHQRILSTRRRSLYYRHAAEKQAELLKVFDAASVTECYERKTSVIPQQALALGNSEMSVLASRRLAGELAGACTDRAAFARAAFVRVLAREATEAEVEASLDFLGEGDGLPRRREALVHALLNHNDFVTVR